MQFARKKAVIDDLTSQQIIELTLNRYYKFNECIIVLFKKLMSMI